MSLSFEESKPAALWKERNSIKPRDTIVIPTVNKTDPTANAATLRQRPNIIQTESLMNDELKKPNRNGHSKW